MLSGGHRRCPSAPARPETAESSRGSVNIQRLRWFRRSGRPTSSPRDPLADPAVFWSQFQADRNAVLHALRARYPLISPAYVEYYLESLAPIRGNPRVLTYIDADLGAPARALDLVDSLQAGGLSLRGARCLDVGCSNGALLLAAKARGAAACVGVDVSADRIRSAQMVCAATDIGFRVLDFTRDPLPPDLGLFDVILCTDNRNGRACPMPTSWTSS
jgi:SAM-dependent methyltransferase